jgi:glutamyl-tRNA reductase
MTSSVSISGLTSKNKIIFIFALIQLHFILIWGFFAGERLHNPTTSVVKAKCPFIATREYLHRQLTMLAEDICEMPTVFHPPIVRGTKYSKRYKYSYFRNGIKRSNSALYSTYDYDSTNDIHIHEQENENENPRISDALDVVVLGLSHHTAPVEVREKLSVPEYMWNDVAGQLCAYDTITEASILSTCNRFEVYLSGPNKYECIRDGMKFLEERAGPSIDSKTLRSSIFVLSGEDAIWHLLRVAGGLDSIVLGEGQILAQVKRAYEHGKNITGHAGKVISRLFGSALTAGKRVRSETEIAKGAVSISSAAAEFTNGILNGQITNDLLLSESFMEENMNNDILRSPSSLNQARIAIIGAGKMARLLLTHLESHDVTNVIIVNRSPERINELQLEFPKLNITCYGMDELYNVIAASEVVYVSTSSPHYLIEPNPLMHSLQQSNRLYTLQLIDISVPRNIHPECNLIPGVSLYNVDHLKVVVDRNSARRQQEIIYAEEILKEEWNKYRQWHQSLHAVPTITKLYAKAELLRIEILQRLNKKLHNLTEKDKNIIDSLSKSIVARLIYDPVKHLSKQKEPENVRSAVNQLQLAFQL